MFSFLTLFLFICICFFLFFVILSFFFFFFFFFSSRRRHTRSLRDWSSDVCSSDLRVFRGPVSAVVSLYEHASRLHRRHPSGPFPNGGRPYPDDGRQRIRDSPDRKSVV